MNELYVVAVRLDDTHGSRIWVCDMFTEMEQAQACCEYLNAALHCDDTIVGYFWYPVQLCDIDYISLLEQS